MESGLGIYKAKMPLGVGSQAPSSPAGRCVREVFAVPRCDMQSLPSKPLRGCPDISAGDVASPSQGNFCRHTPPHPKSPSKPLRGWPGTSAGDVATLPQGNFCRHTPPLFRGSLESLFPRITLEPWGSRAHFLHFWKGKVVPHATNPRWRLHDR